jgi:hypothetical protein
MKHTGKKGTITIRKGGRKPRARPGLGDMRTSECDVHARNALPTTDNPATRQDRASGLPVGSATAFRDLSHGPSLSPFSSMDTVRHGPTHGWPLRGCGSENPIFGEACTHVRRRENFTMYVLAGIYYYLKPEGLLYRKMRGRNPAIVSTETKRQGSKKRLSLRRQTLLINATLTQ